MPSHSIPIDAHPDADRKFLLINTLPTPNGPLHLGHLIPFLNYDVTARHLKRRGVDVQTVAGTDIHEGHVVLTASRLGLAPEVVATEQTARIHEDLADVNIDLDRFVDLTVQETRKRYDAQIVRRWNRLTASQSVQWRRETAPFTDHAPLVGGLAGRCPTCHEEASGYSCESCGDHFAPTDLVDPYPRVGVPSWSPTMLELPYLHVGDVAGFDRAARAILPHSADREWVGRYLARRGPTFRLASADSYGVPLPVPGISRTLFSYGFFPAFIDVAKEELGISSSERVEIGKSIGIDNLIPTAVATQGGLLATGDRPLDFISVNRFLELDGEKFSTSRDHAISVREFIRDRSIPADATRLFLALIAPTDGNTNFVLGEFRRFYRDVYELQIERVPFDVRRLGVRAVVPTGKFLGLLTTLQATQDATLHPSRVDLPEGARTLLRWLDVQPASEARDYPEWVAGFRWLAAPFLPSLTHELDDLMRRR